MKTENNSDITNESEHQNVTEAVKKAFQLNRPLSEDELQYIDQWKNEYGCSSKDIVKACELTIQKAHNPSFAYANRILSYCKKPEK